MKDKKFTALVLIDLLTVAVTFLLAAHTHYLFVFYVLASAIVLHLYKGNLKLYIVTAIIGIILESLTIHFGIWEYTTSDIMGLPLWMPLFWGLASTTIYQFGCRFNKNK